MSSYHPTPERMKRDAISLTELLARALRRLDDLGRYGRDEETFIGHCYQSTGEQRLQVT